MQMVAFWNHEKWLNLIWRANLHFLLTHCVVFRHWVNKAKKSFWCWKHIQRPIRLMYHMRFIPTMLINMIRAISQNLVQECGVKMNALEKYASDGELVAAFSHDWRRKKLPTRLSFHERYSFRIDHWTTSCIEDRNSKIDIGIPILGMHAAKKSLQLPTRGARRSTSNLTTENRHRATEGTYCSGAGPVAFRCHGAKPVASTK